VTDDDAAVCALRWKEMDPGTGWSDRAAHVLSFAQRIDSAGAYDGSDRRAMFYYSVGSFSPGFWVDVMLTAARGTGHSKNHRHHGAGPCLGLCSALGPFSHPEDTSRTE
jgi:hypothetical protein